ncbi:MAG: hypothetical protein JNM70_26200, partial [Anaerolineae bacterium]|nr:hypothetical protein [Anaerolineae bacterium]
DFPLALANVTSRKDGKTLYKPYVMLERKISGVDKDGKAFEGTIKVAVIGFTPPPILSWDKRWLDGKVDVQGVVEAAGNSNKLCRHGAVEVRPPKPCRALERSVLVQDDPFIDKGCPRQKIGEPGTGTAVFGKIHHLRPHVLR